MVLWGRVAFLSCWQQQASCPLLLVLLVVHPAVVMEALEEEQWGLLHCG